MCNSDVLTTEETDNLIQAFINRLGVANDAVGQMSAIGAALDTILAHAKSPDLQLFYTNIVSSLVYSTESVEQMRPVDIEEFQGLLEEGGGAVDAKTVRSLVAAIPRVKPAGDEPIWAMLKLLNEQVVNRLGAAAYLREVGPLQQGLPSELAALFEL